ncbi:MAG: adenosine kinase [Rhodospirillaceae bacterium]|nr:adenosine kinase [Rhodospirillaceae bacterium]
MGSLDVVGIGNAIVDTVAEADDSLLAREDLPKGSMTLIDGARADALRARMGAAVEVCGGSAANTMVGVARLGGAAGYVGKVRDDAAGAVFRSDIEAAGVSFPTPAAADGAATARCLVFVTPDAQRTMTTYLGACVELGPADIDPDFIARARLLYMEGYLWDPPAAKDAFRKALGIAHAAGGRVCLSLSDSFCVDRHRAELRDLVANHIDVLFANEDEAMSLYEVGDFDTALAAARSDCAVAALTRSAKGSVVAGEGAVHTIEAAPVGRVVDTTGAGDLYAAGFLSGLARGFDLARCGRLATLTAGEILGHYGARPEADIAPFVEASQYAL